MEGVVRHDYAAGSVVGLNNTLSFQTGVQKLRRWSKVGKFRPLVENCSVVVVLRRAISRNGFSKKSGPVHYHLQIKINTLRVHSPSPL